LVPPIWFAVMDPKVEQVAWKGMENQQGGVAN
jgi:hypothetical protein